VARATSVNTLCTPSQIKVANLTRRLSVHDLKVRRSECVVFPAAHLYLLYHLSIDSSPYWLKSTCCNARSGPFRQQQSANSTLNCEHASQLVCPLTILLTYTRMQSALSSRIWRRCWHSGEFKFQPNLPRRVHIDLNLTCSQDSQSESIIRTTAIQKAMLEMFVEEA
jgi:hypothetical protein